MLPVQVSSKHKLIGVPLQDSVSNLFPNARQIDFAGAPHLLIPHQPTETFMLRKLGFDAPSPILSNYDWPHPPSFPPFDVQKKTAAMLTMNPRAYVLNGMGTGKTRAALWAWDYLNGNKLANKLLVLAPLSTLKFVWAREVFATLPHRKVAVLHGTKKKRLDALADLSADIYVINHDGLKIILDEITKRKDINAVVIDELGVYRNGQSGRTKTLKKFAAGINWVWGMTGSPMPNAPTDVWSQASIINPGSVPKYFRHFRDEVMTKITQFKYHPKPDAVQRAYAALQPAVRYSLDDVVELPEAIGLNPMRLVEVELGPTQAKVYKDMVDKCHALIATQEITAANAGAAMMKLLQVSTGWVYTADRQIVPLDNDKRVEALVDAVLATDRKVLIFVPFKHTLAGTSLALTKEGIEHACVSGDTSANKRGEIFNLFQNTNKYHALLAHPACLAHGVTLTAADTVIWFGPVTSGEIYEQANFRIRRVGQKHKQLFLHFCSTPVERRIYRMLESKQSVQAKLLDLFEGATESNPER